ncbi:hypothetical protein MPTA5024_02080 [Microbispora sp. ATCC PTA-5024]|nr:hypothetical protein MPTA5024_02080 [Microbispora sp. ATCC PTA-5024]
MAGYAPSTLSTAASGRVFPSKEVVVAFAQACGADPAMWEERWRLASALLGSRRRPDDIQSRPEPLDDDVEAHMALVPERTSLPATLPPEVADFVGRGRELDTAIRDLGGRGANHGGRRVLVITGPPGVGKTAFTVQLAHRLTPAFPEGCLFADLQDKPGAPVDPGEILTRFLRALGVLPEHIPGSVEEQSALYIDIVRNRRLLIVLDNAFNEVQVRPLLPGSPTCRVLITSRRVLYGLSSTRTLVLDPLVGDEAVELFVRVSAQGSPTLDSAEAEAVAELCGRFPLALRIAGARLEARRNWSVGHMADRLRDERRRLSELVAGDLAVRAAFALSFERLAVDDRLMFRRLGLMPGVNFAPEAAAAVAGVSVLAAEFSLERLVDGNLLQSVGPQRYRMHDLLRLYAVERTRMEDGEADRLAAVRRLLTWYARTSHAASIVLMPARRRPPLQTLDPASVPPTAFGGYADAIAWFEAERANLVAATTQAADVGMPNAAWIIPSSLLAFFQLRKHWPDWIVTHRVGLTEAREAGDKYGEVLMLQGLGIAMRELRRYDDAIEHLLYAQEAEHDLGDKYVEASILNSLAAVRFDWGQPELAAEEYQRVLAICREIGNTWGEATTLNNLGEVYFTLRRYADAAASAEAALSLSGEIGNHWGEGFALHILGCTHAEWQRPDRAAEYFTRALETRQAIGDRQGEATTLTRLGDLLNRAGHRGEARELWRRALTIFREIEDPHAGEVAARLGSSRSSDADARPGEALDARGTQSPASTSVNSSGST